MEGSDCTDQGGCSCNAPQWTSPIFEYSHAATGGCSISGGYVYRGCAIPELRGHYFFADYCSAQIWSMRQVNGAAVDVTDRTAELTPPLPFHITWISSFGEDADGELYICALLDGQVFRIVDRAMRDCDGDGHADTCQASPPVGSGDANCDGVVNNLDIDAFVLALIDGRERWEALYSCGFLCATDMNADGVVNNFDIDPFVTCVVSGCR